MENDKQKLSFFKNPFLIISMILVVGIASFFIYEAGFSLEVNLNGEVIGYVKNNEVVEEAVELVQNEVLEIYGEEAYFEKELLVDKVRGHKDDEVDADLLNETMFNVIDIYKPASVIVVDKKDAVAVGTNRVANEVLEHLKMPYQKNDEDRELLDVSFSQEVAIVTKDVLVDNILPYELALLPFINNSETLDTHKLENGDAVTSITPLSNINAKKPTVINLDNDANSPNPNKKANSFIQIDVVSILNEKELESISFETTTKNDDSLYVGNSKVVQAGVDGEKEITTQITLINGKEENRLKVDEKIITKPVERIIAKGTKVRPVYKTVSSGNKGLAAQVVAEAWVHVNNRVPYVYGGNTPSGFDCSGLTQYVYGRSGIYLPHSSGAQAGYGVAVSRANLQSGDLVFFRGPSGNGIGHVGIYIGGGRMIHAPVPGSPVSVVSITGNYFSSKYITARRLT